MNAASTLNSFSLKDVNQMRNPTVWLITGVQDAVKKLTELKNKDDLHAILATYFPKSKVLRVFFDKYPSAWWDFIRKLNKHRRVRPDDPRSVYVDENHIADIMETLLIRGRREDTGENLQKEMRAHLNDPALLRFASKQPSILDGSGYSFSKLDKKTRLESIEKLIIAGLTNNIDECKEWNAPEYFKVVFPRLLYYLNKIFWLNVESLHRAKTLKDFVTSLGKMFDSPEKVEDAWMVVQSFYAWPRVSEIEELCENAKNDISKMENVFQKAGIHIKNVITEQHITGTTIHHAELEMDGKVYGISWRVKTPESILQKMWQKSQYNNVDAMRDIIGLNIVYPDASTEEEKKSLLQTFSILMPNYGYILKNKWAVKKSEWLTEDLTKIPMAIKEEKSEMTHEDFTNMSLSGFMRLWKNYGVEIQFLSQSEATSKKKEDPYYKLRWALDAFFRWPKYRLPSSLYAFIENRVSVPYLELLSCNNLWDLFWKLISDGYLIAYRFPNKKQFFFTVKWKEDAVRAIFPEATSINPSQWTWYEDLRDYVRSDYRMMNNDELTKLRTFSQPPVTDWSIEYADHLNDG